MDLGKGGPHGRREASLLYRPYLLLATQRSGTSRGPVGVSNQPGSQSVIGFWGLSRQRLESQEVNLDGQRRLGGCVISTGGQRAWASAGGSKLATLARKRPADPNRFAICAKFVQLDCRDGLRAIQGALTAPASTAAVPVWQRATLRRALFWLWPFSLPGVCNCKLQEWALWAQCGEPIADRQCTADRILPDVE
jgi:hypothetical protein